jgi:hypothetical protein
VSPGAAAESPSTDSGWVYYPLGVSLQDPTITTVNGTPSDGGCQFSESGRGASSTSVVEVEIALDPSTCTAQFERGAPTSAIAPSAPGPSASDGTLSGSGSSGASAVQGASTDPKSYQDNQWLDPFGIQVNAQEQWITWTTGSCVPSATWNWKLSWLSGDGWSKRWDDNSEHLYCAYFVLANDSAFTNSIFCGGLHTYTYFGWNDSTKTKTPDHLRGYHDGSYEWDYHDFHNGGCANLLHHGHKFSYSG